MSTESGQRRASSAVGAPSDRIQAHRHAQNEFVPSPCKHSPHPLSRPSKSVPSTHKTLNFSLEKAPAEEAALAEAGRRREHIESALIVLLRSQLRRAKRAFPSHASFYKCTRAGSAVVQPRAHKNFRLRRAGKQPLSDVSRAGKQVWTGQKKCPPNSFCA